MEERLDVRYQGQSHELTVPAGADRSALEISSTFHEAHRGRYGFIWPEKAVQIVNVRLKVTAGRKPPAAPQMARGTADSSAATIGRHRAWFGGEAMESQMIDRDRLKAGNRFSGPAVVFQYDTTSVIPPDWTAEVDDQGNLVLDRKQ